MNTNDSIITKTNRAKKMMLWFGMISMSMTFAGLTSAYVVSSSQWSLTRLDFRGSALSSSYQRKYRSPLSQPRVTL